jgi:hypothetical protein
MIKELKRSEVKTGETFYFNHHLLPCVALDCEQVNLTFKPQYLTDFAGKEKLWHVYCPNGSISWTTGDTTVFVKV